MFKEIKATDIKENIVDLLKNNWGLVTAGDSEKYNMMTVSWGAMGELWGKDSVTVYIRPQRYTEEFMNAFDHFTLSFFSLDKKQAVHGICGSKSGRDINKPMLAALHLILTRQHHTLKRQSLFLFVKKWLRVSLTLRNLLTILLRINGIPKRIFIIFILQR